MNMMSGRRTQSMHEGSGYYGSGSRASQVALNISRYSSSNRATNLKPVSENTRNNLHGVNGNSNITVANSKGKSLSFSGFDVKRNPEAPRASLLKYEVKKWVDTSADRREAFKKSQQRFLQTLPDKPDVVQSSFRSSSSSSIAKDNNNNVVEINKVNTKNIKKNTEPKQKTKMVSEKCLYCEEYKEKINELKKELETEKKSTEAKFLQIEIQLEQSLQEREVFTKDMKKMKKQIKRAENDLEEEKIQTRRLGIKLEDANYEIGRLRNELYKLQLENEKITEENEDLAVDNEDLIKDRDEIVQLYDVVYRECERLKHEVEIWKTVFEHSNLPNGIGEEQNNENTEQEDENNLLEDEEVEFVQIEEDQSLLLPPRHDIQIKSIEPSKTFDIVEEIGRGKFGKVYKAMEKSSGDIYAAKYVKVTSKLREDAMNTIEIMKKIHHMRLMNIFDVYDLGSQIVIILEYVGGGMLFERILQKKSLTEADCVFYMRQILQGLHHLHTQNICHLDIKPENIVCVDHNNMDIKIIDFGLAKQLEHKKDIKVTAGSPEFVAPEILSFDPVSLASDMWSIGVFTYALLSGVSPYLGDDNNDTLLNVSCGEYEYADSAFSNISDDAKDFIDMLLMSHPKKRGTTSHCLSHQWLKANPDLKNNKIKLDNMKKFLEKRKEIGNVSAVRAIRRFSSFGVGHGVLKPSPMSSIRSPSPSKHLLVPNAIQSMVIAEGDEDDENEDEGEITISFDTPNIKVTNGDSLKSQTDGRSRANSTNEAIDIPEDTSTADGLRLYLQRMISEGHLPGRGDGPPDMNGEMSDDER